MSADLLLFTDADRYPLDERDRALVADAGVELFELAGHDPQELEACAPGAAAILVYHARLDRELVARLHDCRVIARCGVGWDNIDVAAARAAGIVLTYVPDYGSDDVATHALALLLGAIRRLALCDRAARAGDWPTYPALAPLHNPSGRTLGLLGFGRIARALAAKALALGLRVAAFDPFVDAEAIAAAGVRAVDFDELLAASDYLSIHAPLSEQTRGLLGRDELARLRPGAMVVNTSRGGIVDEAALIDALDKGRLAGAALDVFAEEPLAADSPLRRHPALLLTPHTAAYSEEALAEVRRRALHDALRVLTGDAPRDPIPEPAIR